MDFQPPLPQALEDNLKMLQMLSKRGRPDDDVVDVAASKGQPRQYLVHEPLEERGSILEAEWNHVPLPQLTPHPQERSLSLIVLSHWHLIAARVEIEFGEDHRPLQLLEDVLNRTKGVAVQVGVAVDRPVVTALPQVCVGSILIALTHHHRGTGVFGLVGGPDEALLLRLAVVLSHEVPLHLACGRERR